MSPSRELNGEAGDRESVSGGSATRSLDRLVAENGRLAREVTRLREEVAAFQSSRWWRLHPRFALGRGRVAPGEAVPDDDEPVAERKLPIDFDDEDELLWATVAPFTMTTPARIYALARAVEYVCRSDVPGAVVECGVWRGGSMMAVALTLLRLGVTSRDLYLFDTFEGMTAPGDEDVRHSGERAGDLLAVEVRSSHLWAVASLDQVQGAMLEVGYPEERVHFVQGPVEETVPGRAPDSIALLRLDTDWYASTRHELVHLYPRLAAGGVLIVDDYGYWEGARRAVDEYISENDLPILLNRIDDSARITVRP